MKGLGVEKVVEFLHRAAEKTGFRRERYIEKNIPTQFSDVVVMLFYGDVRSEFVLSSLLLHKLRELYASKYFILCSYPGRSGIYPCVDEYWSFRDDAVIKTLLDSAVGFDNDYNKILFQEQQLNKFFENIVGVDEKYYCNGFSKKYFEEFKWINYSLPSLPSSRVEFNRLINKRSGYKILLYPSRSMRLWHNGKIKVSTSKIEFWVDLAKRLVDSGFAPIVWQDLGTYDISPYLEDKGVYVTETKMLDVLGIMRTVGCVLDVFSGVSRWASMARTPFVSCMERHLYNETKEYELDDLCNNALPYQYIFSFPTIIEGGNWKELIDRIVGKMESFLPRLNRDLWPSTAEQTVVAPYSLVRIRKRKKIGTKFFKVPKI